MGLASCDLGWEEDARIEQQRREWRSMYKVVMSSLTDGTFEILNALPKLNPYQPHAKDPAAFVNYFYPKRIGLANWDLEVRWSTDIDVSLNPLAARAQIEVQSVTRMLPALFDSDGNAVVNMAGDMFTEPATERPVTDLVFHISKNIQTQLPAWVLTHPNCVNSDTVTIKGLQCPPGTLYFSALTIGSDQNVPGATETISLINGKATPFCTAALEISYRRDGWTLIVPNWGYFQIVPSPGVFVPASRKKVSSNTTIVNPKIDIPFSYSRQRIVIGAIGDYPPHPVFLDQYGQAIINPTVDQIITLEFDMHDKVQFGGVLPLT